jgi:uncharacterized protein YdhG (YjbR/CyaY superfamily)
MNPKEKYLNISDYFTTLDERSLKRMEELRSVIRSVVPQAEEVISYNMPSFRYHGILVYYAAFKHHIGFYPASSTALQFFAADLTGYDTSKGTVRFSLDTEIPSGLVERIVLFRARENEMKRG